METCGICLEKTSSFSMLSLYDCHHKHCSNCAKKHLEVKLSQGSGLPKCLQVGCDSRINIQECKRELRPELADVLETRVKEWKIPVHERIYCPYPKCSYLMSKDEVSAPWNWDDMHVECVKCGDEFCTKCKVPWHDKISCSEFKKLHPHSCAEDEMVISLAKMFSWRQCFKCSHMIERSSGCNHVTCRCGYEFCYICELEWRGNKPCGCPLN